MPPFRGDSQLVAPELRHQAKWHVDAIHQERHSSPVERG